MQFRLSLAFIKKWNQFIFKWQHSCPFLFSKNKVYTKEKLNYLEQRNMGAFIGQVDHDYCRVPRMTPEQGSRFLLQNYEGFKRVKVKTTNILI